MIEVRHGPADGNVVTMKNDDNSSINIVKNEEVLGNITKHRQRSQRQRRVFGHYFREDVFEQLVLDSKIDGSRRRGQQRKKYLDDSAIEGNNISKGKLLH